MCRRRNRFYWSRLIQHRRRLDLDAGAAGQELGKRFVFHGDNIPSVGWFPVSDERGGT
jgi:hypothetical protein